MQSNPNRRYLTEWLNDRLNTQIISVIVDVPAGEWNGGWSDDPKQLGSYYQPYTVLTPVTAATPEGTIADPGEIWSMPYSLASYGVTARSLEDQADIARRIVSETVRSAVDLGGVSWGIMNVRTDSIGGIEVNRSVEPRVFSQRDMVLVQINKRRV